MGKTKDCNYIKLFATDYYDIRLNTSVLGIKKFLSDDLRKSFIDIIYNGEEESITIIVPPTYTTLDVFLKPYTKDGEQYPSNDLFFYIELSEGFEKIGLDALYMGGSELDNSLTKLELPTSLTEIDCKLDGLEVYIKDLSSWCGINFNDRPNPASNGGKLYLNYVEITNLEIPENILKISDYAFYNINSITHVNILGTNTIFSKYSFANCENLEYLKSYSSIPEKAFYGSNSKLKTVDLYCSTIGEEAFYDNRNLTKVILHDTVTSVGNGAFYICDNLYQVISESKNPIWNLQEDCNCFQLVAVGFRMYVPLNSKNTYINNNPYFSSNSNWIIEGFDGENQLCPYNDQIWYSNSTDYIIKNYEYPLIVIDNSIAAEFKQNAKIWLPDSVETIDSSAFNRHTILENIILPNSITTIKNDAFAYCSNITNITLPNKLITIESGAFGACEKLKSIGIPQSVTSIGDQAFFGCSNLAKVSIGNTLGTSSLTSIGHTAFKSCNLSAITIPSKVTFIGYEAFSNNTNLTKVTCKKSSPSSVSFNTNGKWNAFGSNTSLTITVPKRSAGYTTAEGWKEYVDKIIKSSF